MAFIANGHDLEGEEFDPSAHPIIGPSSKIVYYGSVPIRKHVFVDDVDDDSPLLLAFPLTSPLIFANVASEARDCCANERTFLSWLRLSVYLAVVSVAIVTTFHLAHQPSELEKRMSLPLGLVFWLLSLGCLGTGLGNYFKTIQKYSKKAALAQSGMKTQVLTGVVSFSIVATCLIFLVTNQTNKGK